MGENKSKAAKAAKPVARKPAAAKAATGRAAAKDATPDAAQKKGTQISCSRGLSAFMADNRLSFGFTS